MSRHRLFLFFSYIASFAAVGASVAGLVAYFSKDGHDPWVGTAGVVQTVLVLASALVFWTTRTVEDIGY